MCVPGRDLKRVAGSLDRLNRGVKNDDPTRQRRVLEGLHVACAHADQRASVDAELGRAGRCNDYLTRPLKQPAGNLEARVLFTDDEDAPVGVRFRGTKLPVSGGVFQSGGLRLPGLGDAYREDDDRRAVLAVRRTEHEVHAFAPSGLPATAIPDA